MSRNQQTNPNRALSRGPRMNGQFSGVKEKPKNLWASVKRLAGYIAANKVLFIVLLVVFIVCNTSRK